MNEELILADDLAQVPSSAFAYTGLAVSALFFIGLAVLLFGLVFHMRLKKQEGIKSNAGIYLLLAGAAIIMLSIIAYPVLNYAALTSAL